MNKKQLEQFDKKFPKYTEIGSPYPIFENVNRNYIKQFISTLLKETRQDIIEQMKNGEICLNCGRPKKNNLSDWCDKCLETL